MARKKNYETSEGRAAQVVVTAGHPTEHPGIEHAYIDMVALLGPAARFGASQRMLDLREWLGLGFDTWVSTAGFCLRAMLLSGSRTTASVTSYENHLHHFFDYLTGDAHPHPHRDARPQSPADLSPLHVQHFIGWLQKRAEDDAWRPSSIRATYKAVKAVLTEMLSQGFITGYASRLFPRGAVTWRGGEGLHTSLSDAEQERLATAIKSDLVAVYHDRLRLRQGAVQGLRLLLVAHRQGLNPTPLLEMRRDALAPGFLPGTIRIRTSKHRSRKVRSSVGRAALAGHEKEPRNEQPDEQELCFDLPEGAILQSAITSTHDLVDGAPAALKQRIWLYQAENTSGAVQERRVTSLERSTLGKIVEELTRRHNLLGDDGQPMRVNLSRLRKSSFDRALRIADGNMVITANLMGNTPRIASKHYPSMNDSRKAEAAGFMNDDYTASMRANGQAVQRSEPRPVHVHPFKAPRDSATNGLLTPTPVSSCQDSIGGEHAPHDGRSHCDRYVMCLFCSSFAIVGTVDELWRLFSFQAFAKAELKYLDDTLGPERTPDDSLEDLRDRYRVAIPYMDDFTQRQFARSRVAQARAMAATGAHPYWQHQMTMSRRARSLNVAKEPRENERRNDTDAGDSLGT